MTGTTLQKAIRSFVREDDHILLDDGATNWLPGLLEDAYLEQEIGQQALEAIVYCDGQFIIQLKPDDYQESTPMFTARYRCKGCGKVHSANDGEYHDEEWFCYSCHQ